MKKIYIIPILALFAVLFYSCERFVAWDDFPLGRFKSYFPYTENQEIKFINGESDIIVFTINKSEYTYSKHKNKPNYDGISTEDFIYNVVMTDNNSKTLTLNHHVTWFADVNDLSYIYSMEINSQDKHYGYYYYSERQKPENIYNDLKDNITARDRDSDDYFIVATGKGIMEFMIEGEKYTLLEE